MAQSKTQHPKTNQNPKLHPNPPTNTAKAPDEWVSGDDPMTGAQASYLKTLGEEAGELASACCRILIQGINESDPGTGKVNRQRLLDEIADVRALISLVEIEIKLTDNEYFEGDERVNRKFRMKSKSMELVNER